MLKHGKAVGRSERLYSLSLAVFFFCVCSVRARLSHLYSRKCRPVKVGQRTASCVQQLPRNRRANNVLTEPALFIHVRLSPLRLLQTHFFIDSWPNMENRSGSSSSVQCASFHRAPVLYLYLQKQAITILAPTGNVGLQAMTIKMVVHISTAATTHLLSAARPPLSAPLRRLAANIYRHMRIYMYI